MTELDQLERKMNEAQKLELANKLIELFKQAAPAEELGKLAEKMLWEALA